MSQVDLLVKKNTYTDKDGEENTGTKITYISI